MAWHSQAAEVPKLVYSACASCHHADGNSSDPKIPKIAGQDAGYILKQLKFFASGVRRNEDMAPVAALLSDDEMVALAQYFSSKKANPGLVKDFRLAEMGRQIFQDGNTDIGLEACAVCHQPNGSGNTRFPRVAGQHQTYTAGQITDFKNGRRATDRQMVDVAKKLTADEIMALAEYMAGLLIVGKN